MNRFPICPQCGQNTAVEKVSRLYVVGSEVKWRRKGRRGDPSEADRLPGEALAPAFAGLSGGQLQALGQRLAPPGGSKGAPLRLIPPDWIVAALTLIAPLFVYQVAARQPEMLWLALAALAGFYAFYAWQRKAILARFAARQQAEQAERRRAEQAVRRWMGLYYCLDDDCVFDPAGGPAAPADQLAGMIYSDPIEPPHLTVS